MSNFFLEFLENQNLLKIAWQNRNFSQICLKKLKFFKNLPGKIEIFREIAWKNRNLLEICLEKSKFCWPGSTTPQISNQIDAAAHTHEHARTHAHIRTHTHTYAVNKLVPCAWLSSGTIEVWRLRFIHSLILDIYRPIAIPPETQSDPLSAQLAAKENSYKKF